MHDEEDAVYGFPLPPPSRFGTSSVQDSCGPLLSFSVMLWCCPCWLRQHSRSRQCIPAFLPGMSGSISLFPATCLHASCLVLTSFLHAPVSYTQRALCSHLFTSLACSCVVVGYLCFFAPTTHVSCTYPLLQQFSLISQTQILLAYIFHNSTLHSKKRRSFLESWPR